MKEKDTNKTKLIVLRVLSIVALVAGIVMIIVGLCLPFTLAVYLPLLLVGAMLLMLGAVLLGFAFYKPLMKWEIRKTVWWMKQTNPDDVDEIMEYANSKAGVNQKKTCPHCGSQIEANSKFCNYCGKEQKTDD